MQYYRTLDEAVRQLRVLLPAPKEDWRLVADPVTGQINGLDHIRGRAIATNGIMVLLENEVGHAQFGHLQWFVPDKSEQNACLSDLWDNVPKAVRQAKPTKLEVHMALYTEL